MVTVILASKDGTLGHLIGQSLSKSNYNVAVARGGSETLRLLYETVVDVLVWDTAIDDLSATELCQRLQETPAWRQIPIIFLAPAAARWLPGSLPLREDRDGLICKPFAAADVQREVERVLAGVIAGDALTLSEGVELDLSAQEVKGRDERRACLTPTEFRLLLYLAERKGSIVSREELLEKVWEFYPGTGSAELVRSHIRNLRAKLRPILDGEELIRTVPRRGYRLG